MKKFFLLATAFLIGCCAANSQILRTEELEKYAMERYGEKWVDAADSLGKVCGLDKNKALTFVQVINAEGKSKHELYIALNHWYTMTFNDANAVIKLNDKDLGVIIGEGCLSDIAGHAGGMNTYFVSIRPVIKSEIKDGKVRITYSVPYYQVEKMAGGGIVGMLAKSFSNGLTGTTDNAGTQINENWVIDECFPFVPKDKHKKASSKAFVMAYAYSNVFMDKIEECVKNGMVGNEDDNW